MRLLPFGVGVGNAGTGLAQPKAQLPEQALALPNAQLDPVLLGNPGRQRLAVPQIPAQSQVPGHLAKSRIDLFELLLVQAPRPARSLPFSQSYQALGFEPPHPILHRTGGITQQFRYFWTGQTLCYQEHAVESMVIAGFL